MQARRTIFVLRSCGAQATARAKVAAAQARRKIFSTSAAATTTAAAIAAVHALGVSGRITGDYTRCFRHLAAHRHGWCLFRCCRTRVGGRGGREATAALPRSRLGVASRAALALAASRQLGEPQPKSTRASAGRILFRRRHEVLTRPVAAVIGRARRGQWSAAPVAPGDA